MYVLPLHCDRLHRSESLSAVYTRHHEQKFLFGLDASRTTCFAGFRSLLDARYRVGLLQVVIILASDQAEEVLISAAVLASFV